MINIITLNYNQTNYTIKCIESILQSNFIDFQIILVDNGSEERNFLELKQNLKKDERINLHRIEQNIGYVGGINVGLNKAVKSGASYFMIMNNDTILDENAIQELLNLCLKNDNKAIVTGKVYHYDEPNKLQDIGYVLENKKLLEYKRIGLNEIDTGQFDFISERDMIDDVFWLFHFELYHKIGGYSSFFWFNAEQADFALRAKNRGYKLLYTPNAKIWHKGSVSIGGRNRNPRLAYWHIQSTLIFRYRHLSRVKFINQYWKVVRSIIASYLKATKAKIDCKPYDFKYPYAKLRGLFYFNKWVFIKNENKGENPFDKT